MQQQSRVGGSLRLMTFRGIDVYVHWSWVVAGVILYMWRGGDPVLFALIYLSLFAIVLLHEFGHALACRSVGGKADLIVLWPLGGIAFVQPPPRPGPLLWSIAAGPLVNVLLAPLLLGLAFAVGALSTPTADQSLLQQMVITINLINAILLIFNMLPVYPLDGGQILQAVLWFFVGRARSLQIAAGIGLFCGLLLGAFALFRNNMWLVIIAAFICLQAWNGMNHARLLIAYERQQRQFQDPSDPRGPSDPWSHGGRGPTRPVDSTSRPVDDGPRP